MGSASVMCGAPARRLIIALGASLLAHYIVVGAWRSGASQSAVSQTGIAARLEAPGSAAEVLLLRDAPGISVESPPTVMHELFNVPQRERHAERAARPVIVTAPAGADTRVYLARELDRYPAPVTALSLNAGTSGAPAGSVRLWVSIDQAGRVTDIEVIDTGSPVVFDVIARERLLGTRFSPAYKDEKAVKSRVLLVVNHDS